MSEDLPGVTSSNVMLEDEKIITAGLWVMELFPPTQLPKLEHALKKNGWNNIPVAILNYTDNQEVLQNSRAGGGMSLWPLVTIKQDDAENTRISLPVDFKAVKLWSVQVGLSLTAVIADFQLSEGAALKIDSVWRESLSRDREGAEYLTQSAPVELHGKARSFLRKWLPGFFSANSEPQPLLDLVLLDQFDPTAKPRTGKSTDQFIKRGEALRTLGIGYDDDEQLTSTELPKLLLSRLKLSNRSLSSVRTWRLWGKRKAIIRGFRNKHYGDSDLFIHHMVNRRIRGIFLMIGIAGFLSVQRKLYAKLRDSAVSQHKKFSVGSVRNLRSQFLKLSLDLSSVFADTKSFWANPLPGQADFISSKNPIYLRDRDYQKNKESINAKLQKWQEGVFDNLIKSDENYRSILSTVASLGGSAEGHKLGRIALWVAVASLGVALVTIFSSRV